MTAGRESLRVFWDSKFAQDGHTGFGDAVLYRYDQPLRLKMIRALVRQLYPHGLAGRTVMDVGCGTGDFARLWAEEGAGRVYALDISPKAIEVTRRRFSALPHVEVMVGAVQDLATLGREVDAVTSITVLQHIVDDEEAVGAVRSIAAILKPDGYLIALEISPHENVAASDPAVLKERTVGEWQDIFSQAGLVQARPPAVYSPLGFCLVQLWIPSAFRRLLGAKWDAVRGCRDAGAGHAAAGLGGRGARWMLRLLYAAARTALLGLTYPIDHFLQVRVSESQAYYHLFVLRRGR